MPVSRASPWRFPRLLLPTVFHEEELPRRAWRRREGGTDRSLHGRGLKQCPSWPASGRKDGCGGDFQATVWKQRAVCHVGRRRLARQGATAPPRSPSRRSVPPAFIGRQSRRHGVADAADPEAGGLGFGHGRMVLRPGPEHVRQRATPLHLALSAMFPLHAVHGELFFFFFNSLIFFC